MRQVVNMNAKWAFSKEATEPPKAMPDNWYWVHLPHSWNDIDGQDGGNDYFRGTAFYAKEIEKSELPKANEYYLELCGANSSATVYANGKEIGHHDGGYSTWRVRLTDVLTEKTLLVIEVDNASNEQVYPQSADFTFYGGLYRDVKLIAVDYSHFDLENFGGQGLKVTPQINGDDAKVKIEVWVTNPKENQQVKYVLEDAKMKLKTTRWYIISPFTDNTHSVKFVKRRNLYMKATGIVRRIDDLGRVVIPKEIRRTLRIREGDPLEIFTDRQGEIILKKYSPMGELSTFAKEYAESLAATLGCTVCVTDRDQIIAVSGYGKKDLQEKFVSKRLEQAMAEREQVLAVLGERKYIPLTDDGTEDFASQVICPIICGGDVLGAVILLDKNDRRRIGETEQKLAVCAANFLGRQIES